ncbi:MinD/ParA family protein [Niallia taxi]|uniref:MinD/ParA family protein n=1 Tax=Niallia taxi TaxID=2499688 RepID=UPI0023A92016|nr:MinD/ParA family protein [Niallia taxi]MDE5051514.1 MinD/ParA family protein [Niallia taxi]WOD62055.1 MinD/ParA family protein [Niallia taxi]
MTDQAAMLRKRFEQFQNPKKQRTLAVVSGKGGVGKSNFSLNFSLSLKLKGFSVLLIDMDIGMGNVDILMGSQPSYSIVDYFKNNASFSDIIHTGAGGIDFIAGGSGLTDFLDMGEDQLARFFQEFESHLSNYDYILFDMGAGISTDTLHFILSVDDVIVLTTPEPTSITDAYAAMKFIHLQKDDIPFYVVVNRTISILDGKETYQKLKNVVGRFLERDIINLGAIPDDQNVAKAVRKQVPFIIFNENSQASKALTEIADRYCKQEFADPQENKKPFMAKLKRLLFER